MLLFIGWFVGWLGETFWIRGGSSLPKEDGTEPPPKGEEERGKRRASSIFCWLYEHSWTAAHNVFNGTELFLGLFHWLGLKMNHAVVLCLECNWPNNGRPKKSASAHRPFLAVAKADFFGNNGNGMRELSRHPVLFLCRKRFRSLASEACSIVQVTALVVKPSPRVAYLDAIAL